MSANYKKDVLPCLWYRHSGQPEIDGIPFSPTTKSVEEHELARDVGEYHITHLYIKNGVIPPLGVIAPQLIHLKIRGISATSQLHNLSSLSQLQWLSLSHNELSDLPQSLSSLSKLEELDLSFNNFSNGLPAVVGQLTSLEVLDLNGCQLTDLPQSLRSLSKLEVLSLSNNKLSDLPQSLSSLSQLEWLSLSGNELSDLPQSLSSLSQLKGLYLPYNDFSKGLPAVVGQLTSLESLYLIQCQLTDLPQSVCSLSQLKELDLSDNKLSDLPQSLSSLTQLEWLSLSGNELSDLPQSLSSLSQLKELDLSDNKLSDLPQRFSCETQLEFLDLAFNNFVRLPPAIHHLSNLKILDLRYNKWLQRLDEEVSQLQNLKELRCNGCESLQSPQYGVCEQGLKAVKKYFADLKVEKEVNSTIPTKASRQLVRRPGDVSPNYIERVDEPESLFKKESSRRDEKQPIPAARKSKVFRRPGDVPPNYINKAEQLESFKEKVSDRRAKIQEKKTSVTEKITELQRELTVTLKDKEEVTDERNEWKYKCNKLEIELYESKQELKRKDELIYSLGSAQADLASTNKELLNDKKRMEEERVKTRAELDIARGKLHKCEEKLQELQSKERITTQERKHLERKLETYKLVVDKLEKKEEELEEQLQNIPRSPSFNSSARDTLPPVTTVADQAEGGVDQEVDSFYDYDESMNTYEESLKSSLADVPVVYHDYTEETVKQKEINTRYGREIKAVEVVSDEVDMLGAEEGIFTKEIENLVADVETETTNFVYIQGKTEEVEINNPYEGGFKEPEDSVLIQNKTDAELAGARIVELAVRVAELEATIVELEATNAVLAARNVELENELPEHKLHTVTPQAREETDELKGITKNIDIPFQDTVQDTVVESKHTVDVDNKHPDVKSKSDNDAGRVEVTDSQLKVEEITQRDGRQATSKSIDEGNVTKERQQYDVPSNLQQRDSADSSGDVSEQQDKILDYVFLPNDLGKKIEQLCQDYSVDDFQILQHPYKWQEVVVLAREAEAKLTTALKDLLADNPQYTEFIVEPFDYDGQSETELLHWQRTLNFDRETTTTGSAVCELIVQAGADSNKVYLAGPAHMMFCKEANEKFQTDKCDIKEIREEIETTPPLRTVAIRSDHKTEVEIQPTPMIAYRYRYKQRYLPPNHHKLYANDCVLFQFNTGKAPQVQRELRSANWFRDEKLREVTTTDCLQAEHQRPLQIAVQGYRGHLYNTVNINRDIRECEGVHLTFVLTSKDKEGHYHILNNGDSGSIVYYIAEEKDGRKIHQPWGMLVQALILPRFNERVYRAVVLNKVFRDIEEDYGLSAGEIQLYQLPNQGAVASDVNVMSQQGNRTGPVPSRSTTAQVHKTSTTLTNQRTTTQADLSNPSNAVSTGPVSSMPSISGSQQTPRVGPTNLCSQNTQQANDLELIPPNHGYPNIQQENDRELVHAGLDYSVPQQATGSPVYSADNLSD